VGVHGEGEGAFAALAALPGVQRCAFLTGITPERTRTLCAMLQPPADGDAAVHATAPHLGAVHAAACANIATLTCLNLERNAQTPLQDAGAIALSRALGANTALTALELGWSRIRADGAAALAELCMRNTCLRRLDLSNDAEVHMGRYDDGGDGGPRNAIGDAGARAIAAALQAPGAALTHLGLAANGLVDAAAAALAGGLRANTTLRALELESNNIGMAGIAALADAVAAHPALRDVTVWYNAARAAGTHAMHVALRRCEVGALCCDADVAACFTLRGVARRLAAVAANEEGRLTGLQMLTDTTRASVAFGSSSGDPFAAMMAQAMGGGSGGAMPSYYDTQLAPARDVARSARRAADALAIVWAWAKRRAALRLERGAQARWAAEHALFPYRPYAHGGHEVYVVRS
jgi:hypothetical protein